MHVAYSSLRHPSKSGHSNPTGKHLKINHVKKLRYKGYMAACHKYQQEIADIQKYIPDWAPTFQ
jgi:hypothetical protein